MVVLAIFALLVAALPHHHRHHVVVGAASPASPAKMMDSLVTFGDSYTDEGRYDYFVRNHGPPPPGSMLPASNHTASGGAAWGRLVAASTGASYFNYAVSGAQCTNEMDGRDLGGAPFPSVLGYQVPAFEQDLRLLPGLSRPDTAVFALWIGTNDLGIVGLLGGRNTPGTTLTTLADCVWHVLDRLYRAGARHLVLLNQVPLDRAPMYTPPSDGGTRDSPFWPDKTAHDVVLYARRIADYATTVNTLFLYGGPFYRRLLRRWPAARLSIFDVHSLFLDVIAHPDAYLDQPPNVTSPYHFCATAPECVDAPEPKTSFMWYDDLHPSERMQAILAKHFVDVVGGRSKYAIHL